MEDIGQPQSGGSRPLAPVADFTLPAADWVSSVDASKDGIVLVIKAQLFYIDMSGRVLWSRSLPPGGIWNAVVTDKGIAAVPVSTAESGTQPPQEVLVYGLRGERRSGYAWPLEMDESLRRVWYSDGVLVGERSAGRARRGVRMQRDSRGHMDDSIAPSDLVTGDKNAVKTSRARWASGEVVLGCRSPWKYGDRQESRGSLEKLKRRVMGWTGRKLSVGGLPFWRPDIDTARIEGTRHLLMTRVSSFTADGGLWAEMHLENPLQLSEEALHPDPGVPSPEGSRVLLVRFDKQGRATAHLFVRDWGNQSRAFVVGDDVYVAMPMAGRLQRWTPIVK